MNDDTLQRIKVSIQIDVMLDLIDESDGHGMVWCDGPYDVTIPLALPTTTPLPVTSTWASEALLPILVGVIIGLCIELAVLLIVWWSIYATLGMLLWLLVSIVS